MNLGQIACKLGIGLAAGVAGTAAMSLSQMIEMRLRGRSPSNTPAKAVQKVFAIHPDDKRAEKQLTRWAHWGYGSSWGAARGLLEAFGVHGTAATGLHFGAIFGTAAWMLPRLRVAPPMREWGPTAIAVETLHHIVYATATGLAFNALQRGEERGVGQRLPWGLVLGGLTALRLRQRPEPTLRERSRAVVNRTIEAGRQAREGELRRALEALARQVREARQSR